MSGDLDRVGEPLGGFGILGAEFGHADAEPYHSPGISYARRASGAVSIPFACPANPHGYAAKWAQQGSNL